MDKKRSLLNVGVSIAFRILLLIGGILVRRFLIKYIGNEANGLNSLYTSIVGVLSVAELGVGTAITFCMYKPIVEGDNDKVSALYGLFTKLYLIIGAIIAAAGCIVMLFLPYLAKDYEASGVNLYFTFGLFLVSVVLSYVYSSKTSLINAYKNNYVTTAINSCGLLLQYGLQIIVLMLTQSFTWYFVCTIAAVAVQWLATEIVVHVKYGGITHNKQKVDKETKAEVVKNVKAMFMHKIGAVFVNSIDGLIISAFIGVVILGKYSNYTTIMTAMTGVITLFFTPLTSIIGHMCVQDDVVEIKKYFNFFYSFNFIIGCVFFLAYYGIIDNLVTVCFGEALEMGKSISFIITLNYFVQFMEQAVRLFKDAAGAFYYDRWKPLYESILNLGLSIAFVYLFKWWIGEDFAVVGIIVATIITNLLICHVVEPHVLYKHVLHGSTKKYYIRNYACMILFVAALIVLHFCMVTIENEWLELLVNGFIAVGIAIVPCAIVIIADKDFRHYCGVAIKKINNRLFKRKQNDEN